ncbi:MAG: DNA cytosine methyltransferase, partial [Desulfarculus sp.]|nr:DNA cytosine methyltransferase [Desulfarculus sp.]
VKGGHFALLSPVLTGVGGRAGQSRPRGAGEPMATITAKGDTALVAPTLIQTGYGEREGQAPRVPGLDKPLGTVVAGGAKHALVSAFLAGAGGPAYGGKPVTVDRPWGTLLAENHQALCAAFLAKHYGGVVGSPLPQPIGTITGVDHHSLVTSHLCKLRGTCKDGQDLRQPAPTCTAGGTHAAEVRALLIKYYGQGVGQALQNPAATVTARDRMGLVTVLVQGQPYVIADIGLRMLQPRELFRAQGFPDSYIIGDDPAQGLSLPKTAQVRLCGNSVCPPIAAALARANAAQAVREVA